MERLESLLCVAIVTWSAQAMWFVMTPCTALEMRSKRKVQKTSAMRTTGIELIMERQRLREQSAEDTNRTDYEVGVECVDWLY